jgi:hypothetical protein
MVDRYSERGPYPPFGGTLWAKRPGAPSEPGANGAGAPSEPGAKGAGAPSEPPGTL